MPNQNIENEIIGGFQNALSRGETLNQARMSFLNAGYSPTEVQNAYIRMAQVNPAAAANPNAPVALLNKNAQSAISVSQKPAVKSHKMLYIITGIVCVLILGGTLVAGLFWDRLFG